MPADIDAVYSEVKHYFDRCAPYYSQIHIDMPFLDNWQFGGLLKEVDTSVAPSVLDLGTGDGNFLRQIGLANSACELIGMDLSPKMIEVARKNLEKESLQATFIQGNVEQITLPDARVHYVVSNGALHHVKDKNALYTEIFRVLKPGGKLFVTDGFDIMDDVFKQEQEQLKEREPEFWNGFLADHQRCMAFMREEIPEDFADHPEEFHISPSALKGLLEQLGFCDIRFKPSPNHIVMYMASKPND